MILSHNSAAVRSVAIGTKRTYREDLLFVRFREQSGHQPAIAGPSRFKSTRPSSLRKNLETEPLFSQVRGRWFWRWIALWSLRSAVDYAATSLGMRIRL